MLLGRPGILPRALLVGVLAFCVVTGCKGKPGAPAGAAVASSPAAAPVAADRGVEFVKGFYAYYDPMIHGKDGTFEAALKQKPEWFDGTLLAALNNDRAIQAKSKDGITGLDADPFGYGQDPASVTSVTETGATGDGVHVETFYQGTKNGALDMQVRCADRCQLVNVFYPDRENVPAYDLLGELKTMHPGK